MFETLVALEELGTVDVDLDGILDFEEIFDVTGLTEEARYTATKFTSTFREVAQILYDKINNSDDLKTAFTAIKVNGYELYDLVQEAVTNEELTDALANLPSKTYADMMNVLYQAAISGDYDVNNIASSLRQVLAESGEDTDISIEYGNFVINTKYGVSVKKTDNGTYKTASGTEYATVQEAVAAEALETIGATASTITVDPVTTNATGELKIGNFTMTVATTDDGSITYNGYASKEAAIEALYAASGSSLSLTEWKIDQGITIVPKISKATASDVDQTQVSNVLATTWDVVRKEWESAKGNADTELAFEAKYGIKLEDGTTEEDWNNFKSVIGIETKNVDLYANIHIVNEEGGDMLSSLLNESGEGINADLNINAGTSSETVQKLQADV